MQNYIFIFFLVFSMQANSAESYYPSGPWLIALDEMYACQAEDGQRIEFDPKSIQAIKIITNDKGPFEEDIFWKLEYTGGSCYFPSSADKDGSFLNYFQDLKGFNNEAVIQSMSSAKNAVFVVWDRNAL